MTPRNGMHVLFTASLFVACALVALGGIPRLIESVNKELKARNEALQDIASAVAACVDEHAVSSLSESLRQIAAAHPGVRAVRVVRDQSGTIAEVGDASGMIDLDDTTSSNTHRITLYQSGVPWGSVHILFAPTTDSSLLHPGRPSFWVGVGVVALGLPLLVTIVDSVRRRIDTSASGPMAVAAERARHTLDTLTEAVLLLDQERRVIFANSALCAAVSVPPERLIHSPVHQLPWTSESEAAPPALPWDSAYRSGAPVRSARLGLRTSSGVTLFMANCTPLFRRRGELHGVLVTLDDVTELEQGRLALQQARDAAEHANQAKGRFLAMMSHEIRTPLNGISGSLQLLTRTSLRERQVQYVDAARFSASTLLHLINDILDFSKIEAGQMELSPLPFNLETCLDDTMLMMVPAARAKGLALAYSLDSQVAPGFTADPDRIRQIIINLTNNAIKFTSNGSVTLRVQVASDSGDRQTLRFDVVDTGIGIPASKLDRLFKAFSQVDSSTCRKYGGTGLGLIISKQLCELMGGRIEVSSVEGSGTTFTFFLDLLKAPPAEPVPGSEMPSGAVLVGLHPLEASNVRRALGLSHDRVIECDDPEEMARGLALDPTLLSMEPVVAVIGCNAFSETAEAARKVRELLAGVECVIVVAAYGPEAPAEGGIPDADHWLLRPLGASRFRAVLESGHSGAPRLMAHRGANAAHDLRGLRILLAEDNPVGRMVVSEMLRSAGAVCDTAEDGAQVLQTVVQDRYDLVLMDCFMPQMDGFEATRGIRELQKQGRLPARLPVIALTAKAMRGDREACLQAGMDGYVTKPVDEQQLLSAVAEHAGRSGGASEAPPVMSTACATATDATELKERFSRCPELLEALVAAFRQASSEDLSGMANALRDRDAHTLEHAAHRLAGGAGFVCATGVYDLAKRLELLAADSQLDNVEPLVEQVRSAVDIALAELDNSLRALTPKPGCPTAPSTEAAS